MKELRCDGGRGARIDLEYQYFARITLRTEIRYGAFMVYIRQEQNKRPEHHKLNVFQLLAIYSVCMGYAIPDVVSATVDGLVDEGLLMRSKTGKLSMSKDYKKIAKEMSGAKNGDVNGPVNGPVSSLKVALRKYI